jgi:hypothetical protein
MWNRRSRGRGHERWVQDGLLLSREPRASGWGASEGGNSGETREGRDMERIEGCDV